MIGSNLLRGALRAEYVLLRGSLLVLDQQVVSRYLSQDAALRQLFGRGLRLLDTAAGRVLGEQTVEARQAAGPSRPTSRVAALPDEREPIDRLAKELEAEQEEAALAGELAEDAEVRQVQAEVRAKHLIQESQEALGRQT